MTSSSGNRYVGVILFVLIFLIYSNAFHASWHFDDYPNIVNNPKMHLRALDLGAVAQTFIVRRPGPDAESTRLQRPVARLSLALNWYFGQDNVIGYRLVNIAIHWMTAWLLYLTLYNLFESPRLQKRYRGSKEFIALLAAVLWAVNPVHTQAVTYIVQRMAAMAALFTIAGIYFYVKGRLRSGTTRRYWLWAGALMSYLLAVGSKENAIMLPLSLALIEIACFQNLNHPETKKKVVGGVVGVGLLVVLGGCLLFYIKKGDPLAYMDTMYHDRPFTMLERLLTEPRVLLFYLSQLFYPMPYRLSIEHDIVVSSSLLSPWTTLPAILLVVLLVGFGVSQIQKRPLIALALLFFFVNHLPEATIFPLELIFEHRNYLPSLFLFVPLAAALKKGIDHYQTVNKPLARLVVIAITLTVTGWGYSTYIRNRTWATETGLWRDALTKAPESGRVYHNLAAGIYQPRGQQQRALEYYQLALEKYRHRQTNRSLTLTNMGYIYLMGGAYQRSLPYFREALRLKPDYGKAYRGEARALIGLKRWEDALEVLQGAKPKGRGRATHYGLMARIYLEQKDPQQAIPWLEKQIQINPYDWKAHFYQGVALESAGEHGQSENHLRQAQTLQSQRPEIGLTLALSLLNAGHKRAAERIVRHLVDAFTLDRIIRGLQRNQQDDSQQFLDYTAVTPLLAEQINSDARTLRTMAYQSAG